MNVLITGAARGIGKEIKAQFEKGGYTVYAPTRSEMDLSDMKSVEEYIASHRDIVFDSIINNAGINEINLCEDMTDDEIQKTFAVDLEAPVRLLRGFTPGLKKSECPRVVNIGSVWAVVSKPGRLLYSAAKNAMHGVTNALALEIAPYGGLCNTVCPGFTLTELTRKNNTPEQIAEISNEIPLLRMAQPCEIAKLVYFLGSYENTYITGQKIAIDGGYTIR